MKFIRLLVLAATLLCAEFGFAGSHECFIGVPLYEVSEANYETVIHRTEWTATDEFAVQFYFWLPGPPVTAWAKMGEIINGSGYDNLITFTHFGSLPETLDWYLPNPGNQHYALNGRLEFGQVNAFGFQEADNTEMADCEDAGYVWNIPEITVTSPSTLTLMNQYTLSTTFDPVGVIASNYKYEIRRASESTWYTLQNGANYQFNGTAKVAGAFKIRVTITVNGQTYTGNEKDLTIQFPTGEQIALNPTVAAATLAAWNDMITDATTTSMRERGFYIYLDTATGLPEFGTTDIGPRTYIDAATGWWVNNVLPSVTVTGPGDSIASPTPLDSPTYRLAFFHTHTPPIFSSAWSVSAGPSTTDNNSATNGTPQIPGLVRDYVTSPIVGGYSWTFSTTKDWITTSITRRATP